MKALGDRHDHLPESPQLVETSQIAWIFDQLAMEHGETVDRTHVGRAIEEAVTAWPGEAHHLWWRWTTEAAESLGMRCRAFDCTFMEACEVTRNGGRLILRLEESGEWIGLAAKHGRKLLLLRPAHTAQRKWVTWGELQASLSVPAPDASLRCVIVDERQITPRGADKHGTEHHAEHMTPLARAWGLLRPELVDVRIVLVFAVVSGLLALATPLAIEALVSTVTFGRLLQPVVILSIMLFAFLAFQAAIRGLKTYVVEIIQRRLFARVAADLAYRLPRARADALEGHSGRELLNRFFEIVTVQKVTAQLLLDGVTLLVNTLVGMVVLGFYHPWLLGFDVVLLAMIAFVILVLGRGAIASSIKESKQKYHVAAWLEDLAGCPIAFRHDGGSQFALGRTDRLIYEYLSARRRHFRILLGQILFVLGLQAVASTALLGLGGWLVIAGQLTLGQLVAAELIVTVIVSSFAKLGKHMESYYDLMASMDKLGHLFDLPIERQDGVLSLPHDAPATCTVKDVAYHHVDGIPGLEGLNLTIQSGERVALTGPSGSGKSVLIDLLFGLRIPDRGHIQIDGIDPRELRPDILRRSVAVVREIEVFEGTLAENVHLERPEINSSVVRDALHQVGLLDEILHLPQGLEMVINSTGYPLSPTQLRKLMLARAIAARPTLLLIDGLLDALPDRDADDLMHFLCQPGAPWTLVIISGRESIVAQASRQIAFSTTARSH